MYNVKSTYTTHTRSICNCGFIIGTTHTNIESIIEEELKWQVQEEAVVVVKKFVISQQTELHTSTTKK